MDFRISGERISVNVPTWAVLQARVAERLAQRQGFALATLNLDHLVKLRASPLFRSAYAAQDLVTADGNPIRNCFLESFDRWKAREFKFCLLTVPSVDLPG